MNEDILDVRLGKIRKAMQRIVVGFYRGPGNRRSSPAAGYPLSPSQWNQSNFSRVFSKVYGVSHRQSNVEA